ncbi:MULTISPECIES: hypothetical protein [Paracoccus]|jgi:hypothetical protein|uniref:Uncharacterized protein n=1 Tax=Paracoccus marcusii TaxID=59779 RepID=A0ABY7UQD8_9RHOB|nr:MULTISPECIES: hypothetical protein [Paracoccus]TNC04401.1 hypothetical protein FHD68_06000 [Paracoccus marcusii]WDA11636.1 hypothetical protein PRL19_10020 [Paracoccus marcusii]|tara:strand:- start:1089 stop:1292 length:204 start_codon:yes stop_codon:yes gene_type:complete
MSHTHSVSVPSQVLRRVLGTAELHCDESEEARILSASDAVEYERQREDIAVLLAILEVAGVGEEDDE